jgi:hypothetical protein
MMKNAFAIILAPTEAVSSSLTLGATTSMVVSILLAKSSLSLDCSITWSANSLTILRFSYLPVVEKQPDGKTIIKGMITSNHIIQTLIPAESIGRRSLGSEHGLKSEQEIIGLADKTRCHNDKTR